MTRDEIVRSLSERWRFSIAEDSSLWSDVGAALQERDAAHEVALKKARADALEEAAVHLEHEPYFGPGPVRDGVLHAVHVLRALLEEAGK